MRSPGLLYLSGGKTRAIIFNKHSTSSDIPTHTYWAKVLLRFDNNKHFFRNLQEAQFLIESYFRIRSLNDLTQKWLPSNFLPRSFFFLKRNSIMRNRCGPQICVQRCSSWVGEREFHNLERRTSREVWEFSSGKISHRMQATRSRSVEKMDFRFGRDDMWNYSSWEEFGKYLLRHRTVLLSSSSYLSGFRLNFCYFDVTWEWWEKLIVHAQYSSRNV